MSRLFFGGRLTHIYALLSSSVSFYPLGHLSLTQCQGRFAWKKEPQLSHFVPFRFTCGVFATLSTEPLVMRVEI